jgi:cobalt-zinc-cadmium efflux system protein
MTGINDHHHHHNDPDYLPSTSYGSVFAIGTALNLALVIAELMFGFWANSLALISDGVHNFSDVLGLVLSWVCSWLATRQPSHIHTYGYRRASILAALSNAGLLLLATGGLLIESAQRIFNTQPVATNTVLWVAMAAIVINTMTALLFMRGHEHDLNIKSAFLHMIADAIVSFAVVVAAVIISQTGWSWLDPVITIVVSIVILWRGWDLMRDALNLALDAVPAGINRSEVEDYLSGLPGVTEVHDLHIWGMSTTESALTVHLVRPKTEVDDRFLIEISNELDHRFRIQHSTIQIENGDEQCPFAPDHVV